MAAFGRNSITRCDHVSFNRNPRLACQQGRITLVPLMMSSHIHMVKRLFITYSFPGLETTIRFRFHQGWNSTCNTHRVLRQFRQLKLFSGSPKDAAAADGEVVSDDAVEQEILEISLEFFHKVALDVLAPPDLVWKLWIDIKSAPLWMRWIDRVDFVDDDAIIDSRSDLPPGLSRLSRWICSTIGFEVVWIARVETVESNLPVRVLRWATVEGLPSRGEVTFKENDTKGTTVELSISHSLPAALGRVMQAGALKDLVQATLQTDMECFQKYAAEAVHRQLECFTNEQDGHTDSG